MKLLIGIAACALALASAARAHDTWMLAKTPPSGATVTFGVTSGMSFPRIEAGPRSDRVAASGWRLGSRSGGFDGMQEGDSVLVVTGEIDGEGTAVGWIAFEPREIDLEEAEVAEYLDEIGAPESLRRAWESLGADRTWHEVYTKYAKAFIRLGDGGDDESCVPALGAAVELVPLRDPTGLAAGDELVVRVLKKGYAVEGQAVGAVCGADGRTTLKYSNQSGHVTIPIHRGGPWLIRATEVRRQSDGTWASDFTTMTFTVGAK
jgi:uncharacterized GH25 family protein